MCVISHNTKKSTKKIQNTKNLPRKGITLFASNLSLVLISLSKWKK